MKALFAAVCLLATWFLAALAGPAVAAEPCDIPGYFLFGGNELKKVAAAVNGTKRLTVAVVGTGSSILAGPDGPQSAYPAKLEAALARRLPGVSVKVVSLVRSRQTTEEMAHGMAKVLAQEKPDLVVWQTGTVDAIRRIDPDAFRDALSEGLDELHKGGVDAVLMNMQYSPRTESMIAMGPFVDTLKVVAQQHEVPVFDRFNIMRHWSETGAFDLYAAGKDNVLAHRVHDCIGRGIATLIIDAAHLKAAEVKAGQ
jgi:lysophospholipase L1-like esterase